jgi:fido (protein-threonine AMPylation protein)
MESHRIIKSSVETRSRIQRDLAAGRLRKIGPKLYTTDLQTPLDDLARSRWTDIVRLIAPGAVIGYRTAIEMGPTPEGVVHLVGKSKRRVTYPGLLVALHPGPGKLSGDTPFLGTLFLASRARGLLESLRPSRRRSAVGLKSLPRDVIESKIEQMIRIGGEAAANDLRDEARCIAQELEAEREFVMLEGIIGTILGSRSERLSSSAAIARTEGRPYDSDRVELFGSLASELADWSPTIRPDPIGTATSFANAAFFDAYFSNWIEGTQFDVEEARAIVFEEKQSTRPADAHDILGTYRMVGDRQEMSRSVATPQVTWNHFFELLCARHAEIMAARPETRPGELKTEPNFAGRTSFVSPELSEGTLRKGFELLKALDGGFRRASFLMFVISEVHPFTDGNGRVARVFMNGELVADGQKRIIIPTVYREDYLLNLKAATNRRGWGGFLSMLDRAQEFVARIDFSSYDRARLELERANAFESPTDSRLVLPSLLSSPDIVDT